MSRIQLRHVRPPKCTLCLAQVVDEAQRCFYPFVLAVVVACVPPAPLSHLRWSESSQHASATAAPNTTCPTYTLPKAFSAASRSTPRGSYGNGALAYTGTQVNPSGDMLQAQSNQAWHGTSNQTHMTYRALRLHEVLGGASWLLCAS